MKTHQSKVQSYSGNKVILYNSVLNETPRAILFNLGKAHNKWVPKSLISRHDRLRKEFEISLHSYNLIFKP